MDKKAFTLIELLVVIVIIGILFAILLPVIAATRERAYLACCVNNIRQLGVAVFMYAEEHDNIIPNVIYDPDTPNLSSYIDDEEVYICPRDTRKELSSEHPSYRKCVHTPYSLLPSDVASAPGASLSETLLYIESDKEEGLPVGWFFGDSDFSDFAFRHNGRTVILFMDGHVSAWTEDQIADHLEFPSMR